MLNIKLSDVFYVNFPRIKWVYVFKNGPTFAPGFQTNKTMANICVTDVQ